MQAVVDKVTVDGRVDASFRTLPAADQERIRQMLAGLAEQSPAQWPRDLVRPLPTSEPLYLLFAPNNLLVIFRRSDDGLTVLDLVLRETIERYFLPRS